MAKTKTPTGEVWGMHGGKLHLFTDVRIGESMLTFPGGQRRAKGGHGTDGYYASEREAAAAMIESARWQLEYHRERLAGLTSMVADCERALAESPAQPPNSDGLGHD
jgi:hypothetical protein